MSSQADQRKHERMQAVFQALGIQGEFAQTAKRALRQTEAYAEARAEGEARAWLEAEAQSFAESAYMLLEQRVEEAGGKAATT